jgi:hypothetical protein
VATSWNRVQVLDGKTQESPLLFAEFTITYKNNFADSILFYKLYPQSVIIKE